MQKSISLFLIAVLVSFSSRGFAQTPEVPVKALFDAMRSHNGGQLTAQFARGALLQRAEANGEIKQNNIARFAEFVSQTDKYLDEKLLAISVHQSGNLAAVWTPYAFYLDGQLSHCGVNSFQLVKIEESWKIQYLIDNSHGGDCELFIRQHGSDN